MNAEGVRNAMQNVSYSETLPIVATKALQSESGFGTAYHSPLRLRGEM